MGLQTRTTLVATLAALLLAGCDGQASGPVPDPPAETGTEAAAAVEVPHFRGHLPVTLGLGRVVVDDDGCLADDAPEWVCDPAQDETYFTFGEARRADLVEARMDLAGGGTSWTVTVRLARRDRVDLRRLGAQAQASGALVLVLDGQDVLLPVAVTDLDDGVISLSQLSKPEAWNLVERVVERDTAGAHR